MAENGEAVSRVQRGEWLWAAWAVTAAFGTYFCMYGLRKPFTAATFADQTYWDLSFKVWLITLQTLGYMLSKFIGIKIISELPHHRRAAAILGLVCSAEASLLLFALIPKPWNAVMMVVNGLALGMVFGLVLGFLEGRRLTELLTAGLCFSFITADGVVKAVGKWLLDYGISEQWMPVTAGGIFLIPLAVGTAMLARVPPPSLADEAARSQRATMTRDERWSLFGKYALGLSGLVVMYLLVTVLRSVRSDFAPEMWQALGTNVVPSTYAISEAWVAIGACGVTGLMVLINNNRLAFFTAIAVCAAGLGLVLASLISWRLTALTGFQFMVLVGLGLYLPYVAMHTTIFERFLAMTRDRGTIGFLMYVADAIGYLGYVAVMMTRQLWVPTQGDFMMFFNVVGWTCASLALVSVAVSWLYFARRVSDDGRQGELV